MSDDLHRVRYIHEIIHERLINWARWCNGGRGGASSSPMFRQYRAPKYQNATEQAYIPVDGIDATAMEKVVGQLPQVHRDVIRWFYVYSARGMGLFQVMRALGVHRDTLTKLVHDGRSMVINRIDKREICARISPQFDSAPAAPVSLSEAGVTVKTKETA